MTILQAIILGLVEGITEYLPVSSTGHLIITAWLLGLTEDAAKKSAIDAFNIIIQGGAILAVLGLYRARVASMIRGIVGRDASGRDLFIKLVIAFLPAAILGLLFDDWLEAKLFHPIPVLIALGGGGVLLLVISPWIRTLVKREATEPADFSMLSMRAPISRRSRVQPRKAQESRGLLRSARARSHLVPWARRARCRGQRAA